jgi:hypothetical protein
MDIQRTERDSTKTNITQNWVGHYYTTNTLGYVHIISKLCYNNQTRYKQVVSNWIYSICGRGYMVVTHSNSPQEKWQTENLYRFQNIKYSHKEGFIPIIFHKWSVEHNSNRVYTILISVWSTSIDAHKVHSASC